MIKERAHAKLNLALDVHGKRTDGYHDLRMILVPLELSDELRFTPAESITLEERIPIPDNAVLRAAFAMQQAFGVSKGARIELVKNIPIGSGLGGESADIAATLRGLNRLWELGLELEELEELALSLGSDTLFCLYERPAYVMGRGEHLLFIEPPPIEGVHLFFNGLDISTEEVFKAHRTRRKRRRFDRLFALYLNESYELFFERTYNDLLKTALMRYPELKSYYYELKKRFRNVMMTGSGSAFFYLDLPFSKPKEVNISLKYNKKHVKTTLKP
ncbi:MAG: 4-(cytidine 5'-diphospho)-2-C-methyl-D-erythritol kinase [Acholeplasmataceae bacterium]